MKLTKYGLLLGSLALLASCSDDKVVDQPNQPTLDPNATTYMDVKIALPSSNGTRADGFDDFYDGEPNEYYIDKGTVYLFDATTGDYVTEGNVEIKGNPGLNSEDDITATVSFTRLAGDPANLVGTNTYKGLVILNNDATAIDNPASGSNLATWCLAEQSKPMYYTSSVTEEKVFVMTNALGWAEKTPATLTGVPTYEVSIGANNLYQDKDAGTSSHDVVTFYVQRVVSKVTVAQNTLNVAKDVYSTLTNDKNGDKVKFSGFYLDVTNTKTYPVQKLGGIKTEIGGTDWTATSLTSTNKLNRFVGGENFTRVYWGEDPNYSGETSNSADFKTLGSYAELPASTDASWIADNWITDNTKAAYCLENTFNVAHMDKDESTRIIFKGVYTVSGSAEGTSFIAYGNYRYALPEGAVSAEQASTSTLMLKQLISDEEELAAAATALQVAEETVVNYYKDGVVYYEVINRHFANAETGLPSDWSRTKGSYALEETYGGDNVNQYFLGRYGMVRNNWYELAINKIWGPGEPTIPTPDDTPDDDVDPYKIDVRINILAWAKRNFGYDLK